ncbi:MAG: hypothetical protein JNG84_00630, partial [Archangium sp.]|nr:hypothetical protein [Archangium sp.]
MRTFVLVAVVLGCGAPTPSPLAPRQPGQRSPPTAECDALDPTRCALPWPSNAFAAADATSVTGLRLSLVPRAIPVRDTPRPLLGVDGFSVATPLAAGFSAHLPADLEAQRPATVMRLFVAQPGEAWGQEVTLRLRVVNDST